MIGTICSCIQIEALGIILPGVTVSFYEEGSLVSAYCHVPAYIANLRNNSRSIVHQLNYLIPQRDLEALKGDP